LPPQPSSYRAVSSSLSTSGFKFLPQENGWLCSVECQLLLRLSLVDPVTSPPIFEPIPHIEPPCASISPGPNVSPFHIFLPPFGLSSVWFFSWRAPPFFLPFIVKVRTRFSLPFSMNHMTPPFFLHSPPLFPPPLVDRTPPPCHRTNPVSPSRGAARNPPYLYSSVGVFFSLPATWMLLRARLETSPMMGFLLLFFLDC